MPVDPEVQARLAQLRDHVADPPRTVAERETLTAQAFEAGGLNSLAVAAAPLAIYTCDLEGRVVSWNRASEDLFGYTANEVLGAPLPFITEELLDLALTGLDALLEGRRADGFNYSPQHRDGRRLHVTTSASLVRDEHGLPAGVIAFTTDLTARQEMSDSLESAHHKWRHLLMNISDTVTIVDEKGRVQETSGQFVSLLGYELDWWAGADGFALIHPDDLERASTKWGDLLANPGGEVRAVLRTRHADGHYESIEYSAVSLLQDPIVHGIVLTTRNVSAEVAAEELLLDEAQVLELIARDAPLADTLLAIAGLIKCHSGGTTCILLMSDDARTLEVGASGSIPPDLLEIVHHTTLAPDPQAAASDLRRPTVIADYAADPRTAAFGTRVEPFGVHAGWSIPIIENRTDELLGVVTTFFTDRREPTDREREVGAVASHLAAVAIERDRWQRELSHQAGHHQLTGLPNRSLIIEHLDAAVIRARADGSQLAVMFIDLDRFKVVNDSLGHAAGDRLIARVGGRLRTLPRSGDFIGHLGADEFIMILEDITDAEDVRFVANRIELALSEPFGLDEGEIYLSASIGVAMSTGGTESSDTLLRQADAAMFRAKDLGRDRTEVFDRNMRNRADEQLRTDRELRTAVEREEFEVFFQPSIDLRTGRMDGAEALLRWNHPDLGLVLPSGFINVAEDTGIIVPIGRWVLDQALAQARAWLDEFPALDPFLLAINLSARQITAPGLVYQIAAALERHRWPAGQLVLELAESVLIDDRDATLDVLTELKTIGVLLAIDDFGTGFSSLNYLHRFPVDIVKVDRTFVTNLRADGEGSPVATAIMHMAHALGLTVAAEGVEEAQQLDGLRVLGCDQAQGFLFSHGRPADDMTDLLRRGPTW